MPNEPPDFDPALPPEVDQPVTPSPEQRKRDVLARRKLLSLHIPGIDHPTIMK